MVTDGLRELKCYENLTQMLKKFDSNFQKILLNFKRNLIQFLGKFGVIFKKNFGNF